jgi:hypothetical protein
MKNIILLIVSLICLNNYGQTKRPLKLAITKTNKVKTQIAAKAEAENAARSEVETTVQQIEKEREKSNSLCLFKFSTDGLTNEQNPSNDFVIYEMPDMSSADIKVAVISTLSSMYKSPKDVISNLGDNIVQLDGYASGVYRTMIGDTSYGHDFSFSLVIQFKDGKIRYNTPSIKQIYMEWPLPGMARLDMQKPLSSLISESNSRFLTVKYFNDLINTINSKIKKSNDW